MPNGPDDWLRDQFTRAYRDQAERYGRFNLIILGKTGVGKSSLVNAIFGEEVASTGIGEPVTQKAHLYVHSPTSSASTTPGDSRSASTPNSWCRS